MPTKRPLCLYNGEKRELAAGDLLATDGSVSKLYAQTAHGLAVGNIVYSSTGNWTKAKADAAGTLGQAIVSAVPDANTVEVTFSGYVSGLSGLTANKYYFCSTATAGAYTTVEPSTYSNPVFFAVSATEILALPWRPLPNPFVGRNLIIDAIFNINQRGYVSGGTLNAGAFGHDRWKAGTGGTGHYTFTQSPNSTVITIASGRTLKQIIEDKSVEGGVYTISWTGTSQCRVGISGATATGAYATSPITTASAGAGQEIDVEFNAGTLSKVKVETGPTATAFCTAGVNYAEEFSMCQRYYQRFGNGYHGGVPSSTYVNVSVPFHVPMRTTPGFELLDNSVSMIVAEVGKTSSGSGIPWTSGDDMGFLVRVDGFTGLTTTATAYINNYGVDWLAASAEL